MKGIITIIVIIVILVVGFLMLRDDSTNVVDVTTETPTAESTETQVDIAVETPDAPTDIDTTGEIIVITYNDDGFEPKKINVSQGQMVRFVNESSGNMWVASDNHPSHKILPEFDNKEAVDAGENYEFIFTEIGDWDYHNHVKPSAVGTVIVE